MLSLFGREICSSITLQNSRSLTHRGIKWSKSNVCFSRMWVILRDKHRVCRCREDAPPERGCQPTRWAAPKPDEDSGKMPERRAQEALLLVWWGFTLIVGAAAQHTESQVVKDRGSGIPQTTGLGFLLKNLRWVYLRRRPAQMLPG